LSEKYDSIDITDLTDGALGFRALSLLALVLDKKADASAKEALTDAVREIGARGEPKDATSVFAGVTKS
jgi:hypothetical protein